MRSNDNLPPVTVLAESQRSDGAKASMLTGCGEAREGAKSNEAAVWLRTLAAGGSDR